MIPPLTLDEAQARLLALASPVECERLAPTQSLGRWLAEPLIARHDRPALSTSAMDGYAVGAADTAGPWQLIGESAAGHPFTGSIQTGQAVRIATGAALPEGAGAVIVQEDTERSGHTLHLAGTGPVRASQHIRAVGEDFRVGESLLSAGTRLSAATIALALSSGHGVVNVRRAVRVALIDCGDELVNDPERPVSHEVAASNAAMLAAMLVPLPVETNLYGPVPDRIDAVVAALNQARDVDLIVTTGGASVGDHDVTRPALERWGAKLDFWRVAIKPGKPLLVAQRGGQIVLGLPGNPVSAYVTAYLFLLPLVRALSGAAEPLPLAEHAPLATDLPAGGARREFLRGTLELGAARALPRQDSGGLLALAQATILIDRPAHSPLLPAGTTASIYRLENGGNA
jgi:molybdopterin molybdotransferase